MAKYITIGETSSEMIPVNEIYAFIYNGGAGKTVLRINVDAVNIKTVAEIKSLFDGRIIRAWEGDEVEVRLPDNSTEMTMQYTLINEYTAYCKDILATYSSVLDNWNIEIGRKTDEEMLAEQNNNEILNAYEVLAEMYESAMMGGE